jgi:alpha-tubulin suppressor-like RCC1 family protein
VCWGDHTWAQWGDGTPANVFPNPDVGLRLEPDLSMPVSLPGPALQLSVGSVHSCVRLSDGVYCWGSSQQGQCGQDPALTRGRAETPHRIDAVGAAAEVEAGGAFTCMRVGGIAHLCVGRNDVAQLGVPPSADTFTPVAVRWM